MLIRWRRLARKNAEEAYNYLKDTLYTDKEVQERRKRSRHIALQHQNIIADFLYSLTNLTKKEALIVLDIVWYAMLAVLLREGWLWIPRLGTVYLTKQKNRKRLPINIAFMPSIRVLLLTYDIENMRKIRSYDYDIAYRHLRNLIVVNYKKKET